MKHYLHIIAVCGFLGVTCFAEERNHLIKIAPVVNIGKSTPGNYDWNTYIKEAKSTVDERDRAYSGLRLLYPRLDEQLARMKATLIKNGGDPKRLDELQRLWKHASDAEVLWISNSYEGGTQRYPARAKARLQTVVFRIKYLMNFEKESGLFNQ